MHCPPFETQNVSTLVRPHFRIHPSPTPPPLKPVTGVTPHHQTSPTTPKNYGFPKTDAPVTRVTTPYRYPLLARGKRGCRCPLRAETLQQVSTTFLFTVQIPSSSSPSITTRLPPVTARPPALPRPATNARGCRTTGAVSTSALTDPRPWL